MKSLVTLFVTKDRWPASYELEAYRRFDSDEGQKFYSEAVKTRKTDSTQYEDIRKTFIVDVITYFLRFSIVKFVFVM